MRTKGYKCYNIKCGSCVGKTLCGEPDDTALGCVDRRVNTMTNADRIRAMSDEELAVFMSSEKYDTDDRYITSAWWLKWLQQPCEESADRDD